MFKKKNKAMTEEQLEIAETKDYFDRIIPGAVRFFTDHYICGNFYKSVWVITEYPPTTRGNDAACAPCGQKRRDAEDLQPPCDER